MSGLTIMNPTESLTEVDTFVYRVGGDSPTGWSEPSR